MSLINNGETDPDRNETPLDARNVGYEQEQPVSLGQKLGADFESGPISAIGRQMERDQERSAETYDVANPWAGPQQPEMAPEEANEKYAPTGPDGKKVKVFDQPVTDGMAKLIAKQKGDEMDRNAVLDRFSDQHGPISNFGAGMVGFMLDPLNAASTFVPGLGEASILNGLGRVGLATTGIAARTAARTVAGATAGAISQAPLTALTYGLDQQQASDFTMRDAFKTVMYAAAGNAIFHAGFFGAGHELGILKPDAAMKFSAAQNASPEAKAILNAPATTQHAAMSSAIGQMVEGREVNVDPLFPKPEDAVSPASVVEKEAQTARDGYSPGLTTAEVLKNKDELFPEEEQKPVPEPGTEGPDIDQYKQHITQEAQRLGVPMDDARLTRAAETMAEDHNPEAPQGGPATEFERARGNLLNGGEIPSVKDEISLHEPNRIGGLDMHGITRGDNLIGNIATKDRGENAVQISTSSIVGQEQGKGLGVEAYAKLTDKVLGSGKELWSDDRVSESASHLYESLARRGYNVEKNPSAQIDPAHPGELITQDGSPVFKIKDNAKTISTKSGDIPRTTANLSAPDRDIESRFAQQVGDHFKQMAYEYTKIPDSQKGVVLNTDAARELSADYLADRTKSSAVHEPASWFIKKLYDEKLAEAPKGDKVPVVQFTAGGTGAGKTTAIRDTPIVRKIADHAQIIYDTNMNTLSGSVEKIEKALAAGKDVNITYVFRDPVDALVNGALPRAMRQEGEFGSGRTVPIKDHIATHVGSLETMKALAEKYKNDPRVEINVIDNSFGKNNAKLIPLDELSNITHDNDIEQKVRGALDEERQKGNISEAVYRGFNESHAGDAGAGGKLPEADRPGPAGQSEQSAGGSAAEAAGAGEQPAIHPDDAAIAELETRLNLSRMTQEEIGALTEAHTNAVAANDMYQTKLRDYAACLASNGV